MAGELRQPVLLRSARHKSQAANYPAVVIPWLTSTTHAAAATLCLHRIHRGQAAFGGAVGQKESTGEALRKPYLAPALQHAGGSRSV